MGRQALTQLCRCAQMSFACLALVNSAALYLAQPIILCNQQTTAHGGCYMSVCHIRIAARYSVSEAEYVTVLRTFSTAHPTISSQPLACCCMMCGTYAGVCPASRPACAGSLTRSEDSQAMQPACQGMLL